MPIPAPRPHARPTRAAPAAVDLLAQARHGLLEATVQPRPAERYATAHLAALRTAAAVLAARTQPAPPKRRGRGGPRSAWLLLAEVAPELSEWAAFFNAGAGKRAAAEAGVPGAVTAREADDLLREVDIFIAVAATTIGVTHQPVLPPNPASQLSRQAG
ncbi:MAG: hypothetical protein QOG53_2234 [Frankiales bacterium]|nr:hypothetical protein [Frankiales bacterium]